jgi:hypothetical protein
LGFLVWKYTIWQPCKGGTTRSKNRMQKCKKKYRADSRKKSGCNWQVHSALIRVQLVPTPDDRIAKMDILKAGKLWKTMRQKFPEIKKDTHEHLHVIFSHICVNARRDTTTRPWPQHIFYSTAKLKLVSLWCTLMKK